jgi:hypothetical protein
MKSKSPGRHLNLEEARKLGKIDQFAKENPATETEAGRFDKLLNAMASGTPSEAHQTSGEETSEGYSETQTRQDTSEDASD